MGKARLLGMARRGVLCLRRSGTVEDCLRTGRRPVERGTRNSGRAHLRVCWAAVSVGKAAAGALGPAAAGSSSRAISCRCSVRCDFPIRTRCCCRGCRSRQRADWRPASVLLRSQRVLAWGRSRFLYAARAVGARRLRFAEPSARLCGRRYDPCHGLYGRDTEDRRARRTEARAFRLLLPARRSGSSPRLVQ